MRTRAEELLDVAVLRFLALCLGTGAALQMAALAVAVFSSPLLLYVPEVR